MKLRYHLVGGMGDPLVYLKGMSSGVQNALENYKGRLLSMSVTPDGNRRFSRKVHMDNVVEGHREGVARIEDGLLHLRNKRSNVVDEVTFWGLSRENKKRPEEELKGLYQLLREFKPRLLKLASENHIHAFMIGDGALLPPDIVHLMEDISGETEQFNSTFRCALALGYDQEGEIDRQAELLIQGNFTGDQSALRKKAFEKAHKGLREPDLMIRAGSNGRHRTSGGFMGPNTALHFFRAHWPTMTERHMDFALHSTIMEQINNGK